MSRRVVAVIAPAAASTALLATDLFEGVGGRIAPALDVDNFLVAATMISWFWLIAAQQRRLGRKIDSMSTATDARVDAALVTVCNALSEYGNQIDIDARVDTLARIADGTVTAPATRPVPGTAR